MTIQFCWDRPSPWGTASKGEPNLEQFDIKISSLSYIFWPPRHSLLKTAMVTILRLCRPSLHVVIRVRFGNAEPVYKLP
jgi:hypothetical protein